MSDDDDDDDDDDDPVEAIGDTPQPPINAIQHIKIKLKSKDSSGQVDYSCSDGIYRSWQVDAH